MGMKKHLFLSVFSVFFALFGGVGVAHAANLPGCDLSVSIDELDGTFDGTEVDDYDISGFDMRVYLSNGQTMHTTAFCSDGDASADTPDESTGKFCWCGLDGYTDANGHTYTSSISTWVFITDDYSSYSDCEAGCASKCLDKIREDPSYFGKFCLTFKEECGGTTTIGGIDESFYDATPEEPTVNSPDWELRFDGGQVVYGTSFCSFANTDFRVPSTVAGQHCWCGISQYVDGANNTYNSIPETWWYQSEMTDINTCNDECASACADQYGTESRIQIDEEIGICYNSSTPHNVTYVCGSGTSITDPTGYFPGDNVTALHAGRCGTPPNGYSAFNNWSCNNNIGTVSGGGTFTMPAADVTCAAQWTPNIYTIRLRNYTNTSTHGTIYEKYNTGWYSNSTATNPLSNASVPTRSGYTFRGFYTATQSDLTASGGSGTRRITNTGGLPANTTFTANTDLYAAWARSCSAGTGCNCTLNINSDGTATYATSAQSGYTLTSGSGTYAPVCSAIDYTVSFVRGNGGAGGTMSSQTGKHIGDTITLPANGFTAPSGYVFNGWNCDNNIGNKAVGSTFTMPAANVTCAAQWAQQITYPFTLTTTSLSANDTFQFKISAAGTFYVDCGDDGILSGPSGSGVSGDTITKSNTNEYTYTCTYSSAGAKNIQFGGGATGYSGLAAIKFSISSSPNDTNVKKIASISGSLGQIFGTIQNPATGSGQPMFSMTFYGASNMTGTNIDDPNNSGMKYALPPTLFDGISGSPVQGMFTRTFSGCSGLTGSIPAGLFGNLTGSPVGSMFLSTFYGCSGLTGSIPSGLFGNLSGSPAHSMFAETFSGCSGLTGSIPAGLFGNLTGSPAVQMFMSTFFGCSGLTGTNINDPNNPGMKYAIPAGLFGNLTGSPEQNMFRSTFAGCSGLTGSIPTGLFGSISGSPAQWMFSATFSGCSGLTGSIPSGLFGSISGSPAQYMFQSTFQNCSGLTGSIPTGLFGSISGSPAESMFSSTFYGCRNLTGTNINDPNKRGVKYAIPAGLFGNLSGSPAQYMFSSTFHGCRGLTGSIPSGLFGSISGSPAQYMFYATFYGCSGLTGTIPSTLFGNISGSPADYMFSSTFSDCSGLTGSIPSGLFGNLTGSPANSMFSHTFQNCSGLTGTNINDPNNSGMKYAIPSGLFGNLTGSPADSMFGNTFLNCSGLTGSIPAGLFGNISGAPASNMFLSTFSGCRGLTGSIPAGLFGNLTGSPAVQMFMNTFQNCSGLTGSIPSGLFGNLTGAPATNMFAGTFQNCSNITGFGDKTYVPGDFLANINTDTSVSGQVSNMFNSTQLNNPCPANTYASTRQQFNTAGKPWCTECPSGTTSPAGSTSASQCVHDYKFSLTTTSLSANSTFQFTMSARGTFYVDCGDGGILSGPSGSGVSGDTITKSDTNEYTYTCTYSSAGAKTIQFGGAATGYSNSPSVSVIRFTSPTLVDAISGDLSQIFPESVSSGSSIPRFVSTFEGCSNLVSIPDTLFSQYTKTGQYMFWYTFKDCTGLGTSNNPGVVPITAGLFSGITGFYTSVPQAGFFYTFQGCTGLTSIPKDLFLGIRNSASVARNTFSSTFQGCTGLTSIPKELFSGITTAGQSLFSGTFQGCTGLTSIPEELFSSITTVGQASFSSTFQGCTGLTSIPSGLFGNLTGSPAQSMFYRTFYGCSNLSSFGDKTYVPGDFLENITTNTSVSDQTTNMFYGTQLNNPCPANTYASTRQQFNNAGKPWCTECPSGTTSPAGSTSASQCVVPFTVTYTCGSGVPGTAPTDTNSYTPNSTVHTVESFGTCSKDGYYASGWVCDGTSVTSGGTFTITANTTCVAQWTGNGISLTWDGGGTPSSCTYGGTFVPPAPAARTGYVFTGWKLRNCFQSLDASISSTATYYYSITNTCCINTACYSGYCSDANFSDLNTGDWKVFFDYGTVVGTSICSETSGTSGTVGTPSATSGSYCWCAATDYTSSNSSQQCSVNNPIWVSRGTVDNCANNCAYRCAGNVKSQSGFRTVLFGQS